MVKKMDQGIEIYEDRLPLDFHLIPDFDGKYGYIVILAPHALVDGVQIMPTFMSINNKPNFDKLRNIATPTLF